MKKFFMFLGFFLFLNSLFALNPDPKWIVGVWKADDNTIWVWESINKGDEGIITIYNQEGKQIDFWGWFYSGGDNYYIKSYYKYYDSYTVYVRGENEFLLQSFRDANKHWVLKRISKTVEKGK